MTLLLLIPLSIGLGLLSFGAFHWALRNDRFDDPDRAAWPSRPPQNPPAKKGKSNGNLATHAQDRNARRGL